MEDEYMDNQERRRSERIHKHFDVDRRMKSEERNTPDTNAPSLWER